MADILLLEDESALRSLLAELLTEEGHDVTQCGDGRIVRDSERVASADLMITDLIMPEVDGLEAIRTVRSINPEVRIIAMSGGGRTVTRDYLPDAKAFGAEVILHKPFTPDEVIEQVRALLAA